MFYLECVEITGNRHVWENGLGFGQDFFFAVAAGDVGQNQALDACLAGQGSGTGGSHVGKMAGHLGFFLKVGRFDHQGIGIPANLNQAVGFTYIADMNQASSGAEFAKHFSRVDALPIRQGRCQPFNQVAPPGPGWDAEGLGFFR